MTQINTKPVPNKTLCQEHRLEGQTFPPQLSSYLQMGSFQFTVVEAGGLVRAPQPSCVSITHHLIS